MTIDTAQRFSTLVRLGYAARGLTYFLLGVLALGTSGKQRAGAQGVFDYLQDMPMGNALLSVVALGLLAYALFKLIAGASNLENHDSDAKGMAARVGQIASGVIHLGLAYAAYRFASGSKSSAGGGGEEAMAQPVMDLELGALLIGLAGLGMLIAAILQAKHALTGDFMKHIAARAPRAVEAVGRAGHAARAVVFAIIGWSLVRAAWLNSEGAVKGLGEALLSLREGGLVYTLVAIGLLMFGAFSLVTARYRVIPQISRGDLRPHLR
ncbi:DUF1206 domain-containing protein [Qipengyuania sediminis]|uniref:DUF1206 domain-containing protein n=1 Tax=Qipengyuania sediminis TaxID=1532023 RepID=UPI001059975E|nr:DUF1206 domain-containing protein [Qipengyuania sediminis]